MNGFRNRRGEFRAGVEVKCRRKLPCDRFQDVQLARGHAYLAAKRPADWESAGADIPILHQAKAEYAKLQ